MCTGDVSVSVNTDFNGGTVCTGEKDRILSIIKRTVPEIIKNYTTIQSLHLTNTYAGLVVTSLISGTSIFLMREGSHLRTPAYRSQRYAFGENSTVCVKRVMFWRSDGISNSWINSVNSLLFMVFSHLCY